MYCTNDVCTVRMMYVLYELFEKIKKIRTFNFYSVLLDRLQLAFSYALENILGEIRKYYCLVNSVFLVYLYSKAWEWEPNVAQGIIVTPAVYPHLEPNFLL